MRGTMTPLERVAATPKGELKNPCSDYTSVTETAAATTIVSLCGPKR
jgi:hypothetical protein